MDLNKIPTTTKSLVFNLNATSASGEETANLNDNALSLILPVKSVAAISSKGWQVYKSNILLT